jgi:hypothetical protein
LTGGVRYLGENAMNRCMGNLIAGLLAFSPAAQGQQLEDRETIGFQNASQWNSRFSVNDYNAESGARFSTMAGCPPETALPYRP